ncbi:MFS transporter [Xenorhabdus mauleonii]|uniref:MFS transporter n=1 Tax=Xenorhabdus mauleonii TaxID=351675 RepID=A0A1I3L3Q2_9GAMM|nr:hypothetical protein [Xenorhabdus mauleonii]PHM44537.1 MFS transporter [Xenorhabdus mauleonii]SFI79246.1 hypothetical protein SAMN05421680_103282 [Xenorhabdus mauleonii]
MPLLIFALFPENHYISVIAFLVIGLVGVPMSPAMITRVMRVSNAGSLVNSGLAFIYCVGWRVKYRSRIWIDCTTVDWVSSGYFCLAFTRTFQSQDCNEAVLMTKRTILDIEDLTYGKN